MQNYPRSVKFFFVALLLFSPLMMLWRNDIIEFVMDHSEAVPASCTAMQEELGKSIIEGRACKKDTDCARADFPCPFGCGNYANVVNTQTKRAVHDRLAVYHKECGYCVDSCDGAIPQEGTPTCVSGSCQLQ
ncbi:MAG: hypothetical protein K0R63_920 [Rickettsiales bacterium]|jgi:hypothetical protein|nr:hypothetical protein [Rickettsiales bacterium]